MKKFVKIIPALLIIIIGISSHAGDDPDYSFSLIPKELLKNAKAIVRLNEVSIDVDKDDALEKHTFVVTIINKNGYDLSIFKEVYDKFIRVSGIRIRILDSNGKKVRTFSGDDIIDHSAINGYALYEDNRVKYFDPEHRQYPFTVEFTYKKKLKSLMFLPYWEVYPDYNCSVEKANLTVHLTKGSKIRYFENNMPQQCSKEEKDEAQTLKWSVSNLPAFSQEDFEEPALNYMPTVYLAPEEFEVDGVTGNMKTWNDFGKWILELNKSRDTLSPSTLKILKDLTNGLTAREKVQKIYEYMQKRTRYVSIQVGIGGWQPFDALTVDRLAYGDCKALANYTFSLLKAIGIRSYYTLILAGENAPYLNSKFPSQFFNHAILSVPLEKDTIFLECTSPYLPYGHIGSFTDDREALMITEQGGILIKTRIYKPEENIVSTKCVINLDYEGSGTSAVKTSYRGSNFDEVKYLSVQSNEDIKKALYSKMNISSFVINDFSFNQPDKNIPLINESVNINLDRYATILNKKIIVPLNLKDRITEIPNITDQRKSDIYIRRPQSIVDTIEYTIPAGFAIEKLPNEYVYDSEFANYQAKCMSAEGKLIYVRKLNVLKGHFAQTDAEKFKVFYTKVSQADLAKATLVRK